MLLALAVNYQFLQDPYLAYHNDWKSMVVNQAVHRVQIQGVLDLALEVFHSDLDHLEVEALEASLKVHRQH